MISCILLAAGAGKRMKCEANKIFLQLGNYSVLQWNLHHMTAVADISEVIIVAAAGEEPVIAKEVAAMGQLP